MAEPPPKSVGTVSWQRMVAPLVVVLVLATSVIRRDTSLSWTVTVLILVGIVAATALYWRFMTRKVLPSLAARPRTWQSRSGHLKISVRCQSCGHAMDGSQTESCPSCGQEMGTTP